MEQSDELVRFLRKNLSRRGLEDFLRRSVCTRPECMTLTSCDRVLSPCGMNWNSAMWFVDDAIDQWRRRLLACVDAEGGHLEHSL